MPRTKLELRVLRILAEADHPMAGIEIADSIGGWRRSSAYVTLAKLQRDALISARWGVGKGRPRRYFEIKDEGRMALNEQT